MTEILMTTWTGSKAHIWATETPRGDLTVCGRYGEIEPQRHLAKLAVCLRCQQKRDREDPLARARITTWSQRRSHIDSGRTTGANQDPQTLCGAEGLTPQWMAQIGVTQQRINALPRCQTCQTENDKDQEQHDDSH